MLTILTYAYCAAIVSTYDEDQRYQRSRKGQQRMERSRPGKDQKTVSRLQCRRPIGAS